MKTILKKGGPVLAAGVATLLLAGCNTIVRENIISSIDTGIGASLAENKQTQMYELKAGYIRSQFYSIPTGKLVKNEKGSGTNGVSNLQDMRSNRADITPQLVAGIRSHTGLQDILLGMDISENFAVGSVAVMSPAATAMYIANAQSDAKATAASTAIQKATAAIQVTPSFTNLPSGSSLGVPSFNQTNQLINP